MDPLTYCSASIRHLSQILDIERESFSSPWDIATFTSTLEDPRCEGIVVIDHGLVIGYCFTITLTNMMHVLNLAVSKSYRRKGIARKLLQKMIFSAALKNKMYVVLEVRQSNVPAISLYSTMGFTHVSTWHRYYSDTNEDANVMIKDLRMNTTKDVECIILKNKEIAPETFHLVLEGEMPSYEPGQFAMVMVSRSSEPFLRRPLAIMSKNGREIEMLYRIKGSGTQLLSQKKIEERVNVLGPLGKGFKKPENGKVIYVAGGMGLPPILSLAERIKEGTLIFGAKSSGDIPLADRIHSIPGIEAIFVTEDGSLGEKGLATDILKQVIERDGSDTTIYACGPEGLLKAAGEMAEDCCVRCQVSLEARMSCGFGACAGCVVDTVHGNKRVCREGPVFNAHEIKWS